MHRETEGDRGNKRGCTLSSPYLYPTNPLSNRRAGRKRERESDPGRDGGAGSRTYLLPSVEFERQQMAL